MTVVTDRVEVLRRNLASLDYDIVIHKGDQVEIRGAKIVFEGKSSLIAKTVAVEQTTFTFRDNSGKPLW